MFRIFFFILFYLSFVTTYANSEIVSKIEVKGNERISEETIIMF